MLLQNDDASQCCRASSEEAADPAVLQQMSNTLLQLFEAELMHNAGGLFLTAAGLRGKKQQIQLCCSRCQTQFCSYWMQN